MDPGSATSFMDIHYQKQYSVVHETVEQFKVVGSYPTEEEALTAALDCQIDVFKTIKAQVLVQVRQSFPEKPLAWQLRMLQDAMESYFLDVGFESLSGYFTVTDQPITDVAPKKRKMATMPRGESKLAKSNTRCGIASTTALKTMSRYTYQTSPFGMS